MPAKPPSQETLPLDGEVLTLERAQQPAEQTLLDPPEPGSDTWDPDRPPTPAGAPPQDPPLRFTVLPRPGVPTATPYVPQPRYLLEQHLGRGGMGEVEAVLDNDIGRLVAVKRRRVGLEDAAGLARFADEIRTVGQLEHPNIVPIHDVGVDDLGRHYFVMKYIQGETLADVVRRLKAGDPETHASYGFEERVRIFRGVLEAVHFAHDAGILHRDLKPANIMVGEHGEVTVLDWGLARPLDPDQPEPEGSPHTIPTPAADTGERLSDTRAGQVLGTPAYMSPEQARGEPLDARSDIYALCVIFHEFVGLEHYLHAYQDSQAMIAGVQQVEPKLLKIPRNSAQGQVPMDLLWFVHAGLHKDRAQRYASVAAMLHRLDERAEGRIPIQCHVTLTQRVLNEATRVAVRHPIAALAGYAVAAIVLAGALVGWAVS
jgi:eukaryotic-like serine/threonine-protein kinase